MTHEMTGPLIRRLRKERGMTQKDLAARLNVTDKAVSKWERDLSLPDVALLLPLAAARIRRTPRRRTRRGTCCPIPAGLRRSAGSGCGYGSLRGSAAAFCWRRRSAGFVT